MKLKAVPADPPTYTPRKSTRRDPWTEAEAREVLAAIDRSGLSRAAFARRYNLPASQLYWWDFRTRTHATAAPIPLSFIPVVPTQRPVANQRSGIELVIDGTTVHVDRDFCEQTLARTISTLRGLPC